jgi:uncharacterized protein YjiS (DUF1127 family)
MSIHTILLNANPEFRQQLRQANEARAAAFHAAWRAALRAVAAPLRRLEARLEAGRRARATYRELSALNDHQLRDIGLSRSELMFVARSIGAEAGDTDVTLADLPRIRSGQASGPQLQRLPRQHEDRRGRPVPSVARQHAAQDQAAPQVLGASASRSRK